MGGWLGNWIAITAFVFLPICLVMYARDVWRAFRNTKRHRIARQIAELSRKMRLEDE